MTTSATHTREDRAAGRPRATTALDVADLLAPATWVDEPFAPDESPWEPATRALNVLEVCNEFAPTVGGSETHNTSEVDFLCRRGHRVTVLAARDRAALETGAIDAEMRRTLAQSQWEWSDEHRVPVYEADDRGRASLFALARRHRALERERGPFDVVVVHRGHLIPAFARARRLVLTLHYMELACPEHIDAPLCDMQPDGRCRCYRERSWWRNAKWWARRRLSGRLADAIVTKYPHIADKLRAAGLPANKIHIVPNWIDARAYGGRRRATPSMPADFGAWAGEASFVFVVLCRMIRAHGPWTAIEAFESIASRCPGARLLAIGDGPELPALQQYVAETGLASRVWFTGRVAHEDVPLWLSWGDAGLAASTVDNFGWRLLEMMAAGLAVIVTDNGEAQHAMSDGVDGIVCAPNQQDVAAAMERAATGRIDAREIGEAARSRIVRDFSMRNLLRYEAILARGDAA